MSHFKKSVLSKVILVLVAPVSAYAQYSGGSGEPNDPYQIATATDLILLGETPGDYDKHFIMTADIDLDPNLPGGRVFDRAVVAPDTIDDMSFDGIAFTGVLDGNDHIISNLNIEGTRYLGLFGQLESGAEIKHLGIIDVNLRSDGGGAGIGGLVGSSRFGTITHCYSEGTVGGGEWPGSSGVGGLVGGNWLGTITHCYSTCAVTGGSRGGSHVGGLVGSNPDGGSNPRKGYIGSSYSTGEVRGDQFVGGLVGSNSGIVIQCSSSSPVTGSAGSIGGLVGLGDLSSSISYSYSTGPVHGRFSVGGLAGSHSGRLFQCYASGEVSDSGKTPLVGGLTGDLPPFFDEPKYCFWDIESSGQATGGGGTGKTTAEMQDPNTFIAAGWDFADLPDGPHNIWVQPETGGYPVLWWQVSPVPSLPTFTGGTGEPDDPYIISTAKELNSIGHNPRLMEYHFMLADDIDLADFYYYPIGGYGFSYRGVFNGNGHTISNLEIPAESGLGGLFGLLEGEVKNLGILDATIIREWNIRESPDNGGVLAVVNRGSIVCCYSTGMILGNGPVVGGLVSWNYGSISRCYSAVGTSGSWSVGGLVGGNDGSISRSYCTGKFHGEAAIGGLVGYNQRGSVNSSFWDMQASGKMCGRIWEGAVACDNSFGKTTAEMQTASIFLDAGWDFINETENGTDDIWWIDEGKDYPRLWWELP